MFVQGAVGTHDIRHALSPEPHDVRPPNVAGNRSAIAAMTAAAIQYMNHQSFYLMRCTTSGTPPHTARDVMPELLAREITWEIMPDRMAHDNNTMPTFQHVNM